MGTRADFYVGQGSKAEWLGSIAWDGYPDGISQDAIGATSELGYRHYVTAFLSATEDSTTPDVGWPWPWETSATTDFAYTYADGEVWASNYGGPWFLASGEVPDDDDPDLPAAVFPDMSERKNVTWGKRSGLMIVSAPVPPPERNEGPT